MAIFFITVIFSSAQLDHWQALTQRPIIDQHSVEQTAYRREIKDNGCKSVPLQIPWLVRQRNRSFCPGPLNRDPMESEKQWRGIQVKCHDDTARVDKAAAQAHKYWNARLDALRCAVPK